MRVIPLIGALALLASLGACGDHYEGGGRRNQVPTDSSTSGGPALGTGDGMSSHGGSANTVGGSDAAGEGGGGGTFPFPFGGAAGSGGTGG